jgi:hypothetical protein
MKKLKFRFLIGKYQFDVTKFVKLPHKPEETVPKNIKKEITKGFLTKLTNKEQVEWNPFVCEIKKIIFSDFINRWFVIVTDSQNDFRVLIAKQCSYLFDNKVIQKGDKVYVKYFTATTLKPKKPKFIIFTKLFKIN